MQTGQLATALQLVKAEGIPMSVQVRGRQLRRLNHLAENSHVCSVAPVGGEMLFEQLRIGPHVVGEQENQWSRGEIDAPVLGISGTAIVVPVILHVRSCARCPFAYDTVGAIAAAVVHDNDFEQRRRERLSFEVRERFCQNRRSIERRNDDTDLEGSAHASHTGDVIPELSRIPAHPIADCASGAPGMLRPDDRSGITSDSRVRERGDEMQCQRRIFVRGAVDNAGRNQERIPFLHAKNLAIDCDHTPAREEHDRFFGVMGMWRMGRTRFQPPAQERHVSRSPRPIDQFDGEQARLVLHNS